MPIYTQILPIFFKALSSTQEPLTPKRPKVKYPYKFHAVVRNGYLVICVNFKQSCYG